METWKMHNPTTRKYEEIDIDVCELVPGQTVIKMFWCNSANRHVTVPGASRYLVTQSLDLVLATD